MLERSVLDMLMCDLGSSSLLLYILLHCCTSSHSLIRIVLHVNLLFLFDRGTRSWRSALKSRDDKSKSWKKR